MILCISVVSVVMSPLLSLILVICVPFLVSVHMFTQMFIAALFMIAKGGNDPNVHQWTNRLKKCGMSIKWNSI